MANSDDAVTEVVGLFDDFDYLQTAVDELQITGVTSEQISVVGNSDVLDARYGDTGQPSSSDADSQADDDTSAGDLVGGLVGGLIAAGGLLIPSAAVTTISLGGIGGAVVTEALSDDADESDHDRIRSRVNEGELALCVAVSNKDEELKAKSILEKHHAKDIQTV